MPQQPPLLTAETGQRPFTIADLLTEATEGRAPKLDTLWEHGFITRGEMEQIAQAAPGVAAYIRQRDRWRAERLVVKRPPPDTPCKPWSRRPGRTDRRVDAEA